MQNTSTIDTVTPQKGLVTDLHENVVSNQLWTYARNAQVNSHIGQSQFIQNEPSNYLCVDLPYTPIGFIKLLNNRWAVFLTDDVNSEIGIFDEKACTYTKLISANCLNFKKDNLIRGAAREMFDCSETIYWTDGNNPRRKLNINNLPFTYTIDDDACETKTFTNQLDCEAILVERDVSVPNITTSVVSSGNLRNGTYQFAIAYAFDKQRVTDYYSVTRPQSIWSHQNFGNSISLSITNLDRDYDQYELVCIYTVDEVTKYVSVGYYSTAQEHVLVSGIRNEYTPIDLTEILTPRAKYPYADKIVANDQYLLWSGVKTTPQLNYQEASMQIETNYVVYQVPADYYAKGGTLVGYCRDEVYAFGIQWLYKNGEYSPVYHIPGLKDEATSKALASGADVYESVVRNVNPETQEVVYKWQAYNTAGTPAAINSTDKSDQRIIATGKMAYWQSSELYPDNTIYGDDKCTPIRHHKFPDNTKTHIYQRGGKFINILGVQFKNIEHPKDYSGNYNLDIIGYRIVRADREGNRSVVAKGVMTNVRNYSENGKEVLYPNYPYNDLRADNFLSQRQTQNKSSETNFQALTGYKTDQFNFYAPHALFRNISLGEELNILTEERATTEGYFENVYKHPQGKLLTQFDLYFALILGALDGYYASTGQKKEVSITQSSTITLGSIQTPAGPTPPQTININRTKTETAVNDALNGMNTLGVDNRSINFLARTLNALAQVGLFAYFALSTAQKVLDIIKEFSPWQDYALQYNSKGSFNDYRSMPQDNRRRHINYYQYLYDGLNTVDGITFNNYKRENSVYLKLNSDIVEPVQEDKSRNTLTEYNICGDITRRVTSNASIYYAQVKRKIPNQYGQVDSVNYIDTGMGTQPLTARLITGSTEKFYESSPIFGGDTYINQMSILRKHNYFSQFLYDVPNTYIYDYRKYRNVAYPRFWMDSTPYDLSGLVSTSPTRSKTPRNSYNLDCNGTNGLSALTVVQGKYFYLFNSGAMEFFVESDFNLDYRDWKTDRVEFYSRFQQDLTTLFRSDKMDTPEQFTYDNTYSKQLIETAALGQRSDFDPLVEESCYTYLRNRIIYSLPASKSQRADNWLTYLSEDKYDFQMAQFGRITAMVALDNQQIGFFFDKAAPYTTIGRDELQLDGSGKTITLGDGGLFARDPRPLLYTDYAYANCQSQNAFVNTQFGLFYPSQRQGRLFLLRGNQLDDITRSGLDYWFNNNLPSKLLEDFPNFKNTDNAVVGTSLLSAFDNNDERYYLSKRDYKVRDDWKGKVIYNEDKNKFYTGSLEVKLSDSSIFEDCSWTISYDPKQQVFISWHDWHPDFTIQGENHFMTVKNNAIWKHNDRYDSFCNFYGKDYPFQFEFVTTTGQNVEVLRSIEYQLDVGKYYYNGSVFHQILDENFDNLVISNNEQISGNLLLTLQNKKDMTQLFRYPQIDSVNELIRVLYNKEEQKYRVNQFWDIVKDRGEFTKKNFPMWVYDANGYTRSINPVAVNYEKVQQFRKKFRSNWHKVLLSKTISGDRKYIFKFNNSKQVNSSR